MSRTIDSISSLWDYLRLGQIPGQERTKITALNPASSHNRQFAQPDRPAAMTLSPVQSDNDRTIDQAAGMPDENLHEAHNTYVEEIKIGWADTSIPLFLTVTIVTTVCEDPETSGTATSCNASVESVGNIVGEDGK